MKNYNLLFSILIILFLSSCKSDDNSDVDVVGTWNLTEYRTSVPTDYNQDGNETTDFLAETNNCYADNTLTFNSDNTALTSGSYAEIYVEIEIGTEDTLIIEQECLSDDDYVADWSQSGNTVTFDGFDGTLSGNQITFIAEGDTYTDIENNIEVEVETDFILVFTKQ